MFSNRSSKSPKRGFGKRRTVVQLNDEPRRQPTYGFGYKPADEAQKPEVANNALSGIMSQYAVDSFSDDNSGEDEEEVAYEDSASHSGKKWPQFVAATDTQLPTVKATESKSVNEKVKPSKPEVVPIVTSEGGGGGGEVKDDIDLKLKDFLAEIESIDVPEKPAVEESSVEGKPPDAAASAAAADSDADNGIGTSEDDASPPVEPKEPITMWQHCMDEGTHCYYYWHTETNEVTWEIPLEFSQYLLRYKEYERLLAKYEKDVTEWKKLHGNKKPRKSAKKDRKHKKKVEEEKELIEPLVSYPPIQEEDEDQEEEEAPLVYGPQKPPEDVLEQLEKEDSTEVNATGAHEKGAEEHMNEDGKDVKNLVAPSEVVASLEGDVMPVAPKKHHHHHHHHQSALPKKLGEGDVTEVEKHSPKVRSHGQKTRPPKGDEKNKLHGSKIKDGVEGKTGETHSDSALASPCAESLAHRETKKKKVPTATLR